MLSDPIGDMLARIKNGYSAGKKQVIMPYSKVKAEIARVLLENDYLDNFSKTGKEKQNLICQLKYNHNQPVVSKIIRISKPSLRVYLVKKKLVKILDRRSKVIISTSKGMMTVRQARKKGLGGEIIAKIW